MIEVIKPVQVVQIPLQRGLLAVDLECVQGLVPASVPGGFKQPQRAVVEPAKEGTSVVDSHRLDLAGEVMLSFFHERLGHGADGIDVPVEPEGRVDAVREQVAGDARAGRRHIEPPKRGSALRKIC